MQQVCQLLNRRKLAALLLIPLKTLFHLVADRLFERTSACNLRDP